MGSCEIMLQKLGVNSKQVRLNTECISDQLISSSTISSNHTSKLGSYKETFLHFTFHLCVEGFSYLLNTMKNGTISGD